ncbi:MAG TPA: ABC transporter permease [Candidatus Acidoferrales bacterium]|nr:ABC transporter permease [Candidatus Acidoferrales bacterium]
MSLFSALLNLFRRDRAERDLDAEVRAHLDLLTEEKLRAGLPPDEARRAARIDLGGIEQVKEEVRSVRAGAWLEQFWQDVRFGARQLRRNPGFTAVAVLTLALGIGANGAIFSVVHATLLQPLPSRNAGRLAVIWVNNLEHGWSRIGPTGLDYLDWREQSKSFDDLFLFEHGSGTVTGQGEPEQVAGLRVTTNFGGFFGIKPLLGRTFRLDEGAARHNFALLGYGYWQRRFGSDASVVGRGMTLNGDSYTIIGVLTPEFAILFPADVVVPFDSDWVKRADTDLGVFGMLKSGVTLDQASAEMSVIAKRVAIARPSRRGFGVLLVRLADVRVEYLRPALLVLLGAVGFVLLIACANVANLMLARSLARRREVGIRLALGAGRPRLIRQFLAESMLLSVLGGAAGSLLALWSTGLLAVFVPSRIPVPNAADQVLLPEFHMGGAAFAFMAIVSLFAGILLGLIPALQSLRSNVNESLKEGGRGFSSGPRAHRTRSALVIAESALAFVLVIGAGLMIKSFWRLLQADPGFHTDHLLTLRIKLPTDAGDSPYREPRQRAAAFLRFLAGVEAVPGVQAAAFSEIVPLSQDDMDMGYFVVQEDPPLPPGEHLAADYRDVTPGYFATMGIPLKRGRAFTEQDDLDHPRVVIIDETLARRFFPNLDPIGRHLRVPDATRPEREIVGVAGGVRDTGFDQQPRPTIYFPSLQSPDQTMSLVVRSALPPGSLLPAIKNAIWAVDKNQPVFLVRSMDEMISGIVSAQRLAFLLLGVFALLALALAAIGIYGVTSYVVSERTHEIGVRMALGAQPLDVSRLVLGHGATLACMGVMGGLLAALALTRLLSSLLFGVSATDVPTFAGVAALLLFVALAACYFPARRATRVDPIRALRNE